MENNTSSPLDKQQKSNLDTNLEKWGDNNRGTLSQLIMNLDKDSIYKRTESVRGAINHWANGTRPLPENLKDKIEQVTGVTITDLINISLNYDNQGDRLIGSSKAFPSQDHDEKISSDIEGIIRQTELSNTEKTRLILSRIGQGSFREKLVELWYGCSVTNYQQTSLLIASHIKPWSQSDNKERLDPYNGFLLLPSLDKAFDLGFISLGLSQITSPIHL